MAIVENNKRRYKMFSLNPVVHLLTVSLLCNTYLSQDNCRERYRLVGDNKSDMYKIIDVKIQQTVQLDCHYCQEKSDSLPKLWFRQDFPLLEPPQELRLDMESDPDLRRVHVTPDHTLVVRNVSAADVGVYYCHGEGRRLSLNYLLDVVDADLEPAVGNMTAWRQYQVARLLPQNEHLQNFVVVTEWESWGPCVACNRPRGARRRLGRCRLKQSVKSGTAAVAGLSCHSKLLAKLYPNTSALTRAIPDFILTEPCTGSCRTGSWTPSSRRPRYRKRHVLPSGARLTVACPGANLEAMVTWLKDGDLVTPEAQSHVTIDTFSALHLMGVTQEDEGNYTCFVDDTRVQEFIVIVTTQTETHTRELIRHMSYLGFIFLLSFIFYCAGLCAAWTRRRSFLGYNNIL